MKTRAVRLHGVMDLRLEEIELPEIKDGEILACIISPLIDEVAQYELHHRARLTREFPTMLRKIPLLSVTNSAVRL